MRFLAAALLPLLIAAAPPPGVPTKELTIERVFDSPSLSGPVPRLPKLSPDGRYLAGLRNPPDDLQRYDLWAIAKNRELTAIPDRKRTRLNSTNLVISYAGACLETDR